MLTSKQAINYVSKLATVRRMEATGHIASWVAISLTSLMVGNWVGPEGNPVSRFLIESMGFVGYGLLATVLVSLMYRLTHRHGNRAYSILPTTILTLDALGNLWAVFNYGTPETFRLLEIIAVSASIGLLALLLYYRVPHRFHTAIKKNTAFRRSTFRVGVVVMVVALSFSGVAPFIGNSPLENASAASSNTTYIEDFEDGLGIFSGEPFSRTSQTSEVYEGNYALEIPSENSAATAQFTHQSYNSFSFAIMANSFGGSDTPGIVPRDSTVSGSGSWTGLDIGSSGEFKIWDENTDSYKTQSSYTMNPGEYYIVQWRNIDYNNHQYDFVVYDSNYDKVVEFTDLSFSYNNAQGIDTLYINANGGDFHMDSIRGGLSSNTEYFGTSDVSGTVTDTTGEPLSDTPITVTNQSGGVVTSTTTGGTGSYSVSLPDGTYSIEADPSGYNAAIQEVTVSGTAIPGVDFTFGSPLKVTVADENGENLAKEDITVVGYGVNEPALNISDAQELETEASRIRNDIQSFDVDKIGYDDSLQLTGSGGEFRNTGENYPAVHTREDWGLTGWADGANLGQPMIQVPEGQEVVLSVWDPTAGGIQDGVETDLPGGVVDDSYVNVQRLDAKGGVATSANIQTDETYDVGLAGGSHSYATWNPQPGFYRLTAGATGHSYVIVVGNPDDLANTILSDWRSDENQRTAQAQNIRDYINQGHLETYRNTTVTTGNESVAVLSGVGSGVDTLTVQAYTASGTLSLSDPQNATIQDIRNAAEAQNYNGSYYVTTRPVTVNVSKNNETTVYVREVSALGYQNITDWQNRLDWLEQAFSNQSFADAVAESLGMDPDSQDQIRSELETVREENEELRNRYEELAQDYRDENDISEVTNETELRLLRQSVRDLQGSLKADDGNTESTFQNGTVDATIPYDGDLDPNALSVTAHFPSEGYSTSVPSEYVSVDKRVGQGDVLTITDYPVPDGASVVTFSHTVSGEDGQKIGNGKSTFANPAFNGKLMSLQAVSLSTISPGPSETVRVTPSADSESNAIASVSGSVDGPSGTVTTTSAGSDGFEFQTDGSGNYFITMNITDSNGEVWTESLAIEAREQNLEQPASVRAREGFLGSYAVVSDGIIDGDVETSGGVVRSTAIAPSDDIPSTVHFYTEQVSNNYRNTEVRVMKQSGGGEPTSVNRNIKVQIHTTDLADDAIVYRGGTQPLKVGETTPYGTITCSGSGDGCTIKTFTDADGAAQVTVNNNPTIIDSALHWVRLNIPGGQSIPALTIQPPSELVELEIPEPPTLGMTGTSSGGVPA